MSWPNVRNLRVESLSSEQYAELMRSRPCPLYYLPWWLQEASSRLIYLLCSAEEEPLAVLVGELDRGRMLTPRFCQYTGILYFDPNFTAQQRQNIDRAIVAALPRHRYFHLNFPPSYIDWLAFYWQEYQQTTRYNYSWDVSEIWDRDHFLASIGTTLRKNLKASERAGFVYDPVIASAEALELFAKTSQYKGYRSDLALQARLIERSLGQGVGRLVGLRTREGELAMAAFWVEHIGCAYLIGEGCDRALSGKHQLKCLLLLHYVLERRGRIDTIDFEGSMLEPIAKIYQALGARQQPYMVVYRGRKYSFEFLIGSLRQRLFRR